jgi:ribose transport system ATP-binding protein
LEGIILNENILEMKNITKRYPGVLALDNVGFSLNKGEVHALVGENGAGKSTLVKILSGAVQKTEGEILINGKKVSLSNPIAAKKLGINQIYQELNLAFNMSVMENIFLGNMPKKKYFVDFDTMYEESKKVLDELNINIDPRTKIEDLGVGDQQMIEIAKSIYAEPDILIMDEPTAALSKAEIDRLFSVILSLKEKGKSIIYISHRLEELWQIGDRATVLREGKKIFTKSLSDLTENSITTAMVGREIEEKYPSFSIERGEKILSVKNLSSADKLKNISFDLHEGEILGIAGLVGAGRTELMRAIFGADKIDEGEISIKGKNVKINNPYQAIDNGIGLIPEDRKSHGLVLDLSIKKNITLPILKRLSKYGFINQKEDFDIAENYRNKMSIKTPDVDFISRHLSGGNQQKVVIAKWLSANVDIILFDEPTRGIDVGAKIEVYDLMIELLKEGVGIIMTSSELPEILEMSNRILVLHRGEITGEFEKDEISDICQEDILSCAMGSDRNEK